MRKEPTLCGDTLRGDRAADQSGQGEEEKGTGSQGGPQGVLQRATEKDNLFCVSKILLSLI